MKTTRSRLKIFEIYYFFLSKTAKCIKEKIDVTKNDTEMARINYMNLDEIIHIIKTSRREYIHNTITPDC